MLRNGVAYSDLWGPLPHQNLRKAWGFLVGKNRRLTNRIIKSRWTGSAGKGLFWFGLTLEQAKLLYQDGTQDCELICLTQNQLRRSPLEHWDRYVPQYGEAWHLVLNAPVSSKSCVALCPIDPLSRFCRLSIGGNRTLTKFSARAFMGLRLRHLFTTINCSRSKIRYGICNNWPRKGHRINQTALLPPYVCQLVRK